MNQSAAGDNVDSGKVCRRSFLRIAPAMVGLGILSGAKNSASAADESLEQAFLGGVLLFPKAMRAYYTMPIWVFVSQRNMDLFGAMRTSYLQVSDGDKLIVDNPAIFDRMFSDVIHGRRYPTSLLTGKVLPDELPRVARELVGLARRRQPSLPCIEFYDRWLL